MMTNLSYKLEAGVKAPAFSLSNQLDENVSSKDFSGSKFLLYFYPRASTPGCTIQACSVRDSFAEFKKLDLKIAAISPDLPGKLKKFAEKQALGFNLLSDPEMKIAQSYGVVGEKVMFGKTKIGIIRSSFLIDEKGRVLSAWYKVKPAEMVSLALEFLVKMV